MTKTIKVKDFKDIPLAISEADKRAMKKAGIDIPDDDIDTGIESITPTAYDSLDEAIAMVQTKRNEFINKERVKRTYTKNPNTIRKKRQLCKICETCGQQIKMVTTIEPKTKDAKKLIDIMQRNNIDQKKLFAMLEISSGRFAHWMAGRNKVPQIMFDALAYRGYK